jgi:DNA-binding NarL/FixJ family response regulator
MSVTVERTAQGSAPVAQARVLMVDDRRLLANALGIAIGTDPELDVVGIYDDPVAAAEFARASRPDVLVLDFFTLTRSGGAALISTLQLHSPQTKILVLTQQEDPQTLLTCIQRGADGYLTKQSSPGTLIEAIKRLRTGDVLYPAAVLADLLIDAPLRRAEPNGASHSLLVPRELAVLQALADGLQTAEVAAKLGIKAHTVRAYLRSTLTKLGARSRLDAVLIGVRSGLINLNE